MTRKKISKFFIENPKLYFLFIFLSLLMAIFSLLLKDYTPKYIWKTIALTSALTYCYLQYQLNIVHIYLEIIKFYMGSSKLFSKNKNFDITIRLNDYVHLGLITALIVLAPPNDWLVLLVVLIGFIVDWSGRLIAAYA